MPARRLGFAFGSIFAAFFAATWFGCAKAGETPCQFNSDCSVGYCGPDLVCHQNCVDSTRDCPAGYLCDENAQCVPKGGSGGGANVGGGGPNAGGGSNVGGAGTGGNPSGSTTMSGNPSGSVSSSHASTGSGNPGTEHELELCGSDGDCASPLICRVMTPTGEKRCTRTCGAKADCMTGTTCDAIGAEQYCAAIDTGAHCTDGPGQCNYACLKSQGYCTNVCNDGSDCPNGYGCMGVGSPAIYVCVKDEAPCDSSDASACIATSACDVGSNMVVGGCTSLCRSAADCPRRAADLNAWTCPGGTQQHPALCRRPGDVAGPLETGSAPAQWACNGSGTVVNVCNDALHIDFDQFTIPNPPSVSCAATMTTDGLPGDACVDSCRYQGYCPFGSACVGVGSIAGGRAGLCLPTGSGEVGTACAHDRDCTFGYCLTAGTCSRDCTADGICPNGTTCTAGGGPAVEGQPFRRCQ